jgi:hypothetical protein
MNANVPPLPPFGTLTNNPPRPVASAQSLGGIPGVAGMTLDNLMYEVARGGRFVIFQYSFSVLVMSFKRSSGVVFLKAGEGSFGKSARYSLISLVAGWWGIPWGPIWTISTIATNLGGGKDVTAPLLARVGLQMPAPTARV